MSLSAQSFYSEKINSLIGIVFQKEKKKKLMCFFSLFQESTRIIKEIFGTNWIKKEEIQNLIKWLNDGCITLQDNNNKKQV